MRPYLAIIQDSFREALASRTLQVLLVLITVLLLGLAVPGLRIERPWELTADEIQNADGLASLLGRTRDGALTSAQTAIRDRLSPELQQQFVVYRSDASAENRDAAVDRFVTELNPLLQGESLYDADAFRDVQLSPEGRKLLGQSWEDLTKPERNRLNRILVDGAFAGHVRQVDPLRAYLTYVFDEWELTIPPEVVQTLIHSVVYLLLKWFVGAAGMLAAIIFTASMIPQMFEPGAIDLLLSKPISRSAAFLARFCGGCAFILLNASLFVIGLWVILGLRHGDWSPGVLWAIPLFLLAFSIYFSISAYVGVRWRNPILAIALALVAWIITFSLHQLWFWGQRIALDGERAEIVLASDDGPMVARKNGEIIHWDQAEWRPIFTEAINDPGVAMQRNTGLMYPLLGPVLTGEADQRRLIAIERRVIPPLFSSNGNVVTGTAAEAWQRESGPTAPTDAFAVVSDGDYGALLVTRSGLTRVVVVAGDDPETAELTLKPLDSPRAVWHEPVDVSVDESTGVIGVYSRGRISLVGRQPSGDYDMGLEHDTGRPSPALIAVAAGQVVLARPDGTIERFDRRSLSALGAPVQLPAAPKRIIASADGASVLLLDHERHLHRLDEEGRLSIADVRGQGNITAITISHDGSLLVADRFPRVTSYGPQGNVLETWERHTGFAWAYLWVINPMRLILPKPDELDLLVREAVGARDGEQGPGGEDLTREREYVDIWTPVWTSGLFVLFMLAVTCWTIERRDY